MPVGLAVGLHGDPVRVCVEDILVYGVMSLGAFAVVIGMVVAPSPICPSFSLAHSGKRPVSAMTLADIDAIVAVLVVVPAVIVAVVAIVIAERRLPHETILESDPAPPNGVAVATVDGIGKTGLNEQGIHEFVEPGTDRNARVIDLAGRQLAQVGVVQEGLAKAGLVSPAVGGDGPIGAAD
jgi:hypothetical protein